MFNNDTLLQYYVALNWAREFMGDINGGSTKFQMIKANGEITDITLDVREQQSRVIEILEELVEFDNQQGDQRIYRVK